MLPNTTENTAEALNEKKKLDTVEHACNPRIQGVENYEFEATLDQR